jgi:hypothetical protein
LIPKYLIEEVSLLVDIIHKQLLFLLGVVHEGQRLNHLEEEALVDQELLPFVCVEHLLGVG